MTKWNEIPLHPDTPKEEIAAQFDAQYAENKAAGDIKQEQDPYRRPNPTGGGK